MAHKKLKRSELIYSYITSNFENFLKETTLHGLKYLADRSLSIWEKLFFFTSFATAFVIVINLIANVYTLWDTTPVIIGINPHPTSILDVPFPAMTLCNMNLVLKSKVSNYSRDSLEFDVLQFLCMTTTEYNDMLTKRGNLQNNNLRIDDFILQHGQPCSRLLLHCQVSSIVYNCSDLFREVVTDEGLCCVFNTVHPHFLYKENYKIINELTNGKGTEAVDWNPESGYPSILPKKFYPRPGTGTGVSMGVSIILKAELDEYYCSSGNGAGFKIAIHNPIETPSIKETGLSVPLGYETRFRIDAVHSEAVSAIRSIHRKRRQCIFAKEVRLLFFKYYTRKNCILECESAYFYKKCVCIPFDYPPIYGNATVCTMKETACVDKAYQAWAKESLANTCAIECLPSCFDLTFLPYSFPSPLAERNFTIQNSFLQNMPKSELRKNFAIIHFYYRESVIYGDIKNVYIGFTEFLSNVGGIMGLFMGFSFISVAEIVYFVVLRPVAQLMLPHNFKTVSLIKNNKRINFLP